MIFRVARQAENLLIFGLAASGLICAAYSMVTRYILPEFAFDWIEELMTFCVVWSIWIAGARVLVTSDHVRSDAITALLSQRWQGILRRAGDLAAGVFCLIIAFGGFQVVMLALALDERSDAGFAAPIWIYDLSMPTALLVAGLRFLAIASKASLRDDA